MWRVEMLRQEHRPTHHQPSPSSPASLLPRPWSSARVLLCQPTLWEGCPLTRPTPIPAPITIFTSVWVSTHHLTHQQGPSFGSCTGCHTSRFKVPIISLFALLFSLSELSNPGCSDSPSLSPYPHLITGLQCILLLPPAPRLHVSPTNSLLWRWIYQDDVSHLWVLAEHPCGFPMLLSHVCRSEFWDVTDDSVSFLTGWPSAL